MAAALPILSSHICQRGLNVGGGDWGSLRKERPKKRFPLFKLDSVFLTSEDADRLFVIRGSSIEIIPISLAPRFFMKRVKYSGRL
jgi:hypothetical protein